MTISGMLVGIVITVIIILFAAYILSEVDEILRKIIGVTRKMHCC